MNGSWYYFYGSGAMAKNWLAAGSDWYYLGEDGAMKNRLQSVKGAVGIICTIRMILMEESGE